MASFIVLDSNGCKPLNVQFVDLSEAWTPLSYEWDFGNGGFSDEASPSMNYTYSGQFFPSLTVSTSSGCIGNNTYTLEWPIHVYPIPQANFMVEPNIVEILDPEVYITDLSQSSSYVLYYLSNGDTINTPNAAYSFYDAGTHQITQTAFNEYGCTHQVIGAVQVKGFMFYMPNSFTPNGDGYNDVIKPEFTGVSEYSMQIFDRWGQNIFTSFDPNYGWDGGDSNTGVYNYIIKLSDLTKLPHHYSGSITLIR